MERLSSSLLLPSEVAIVKVPGHSKANSFVAKGNEAADIAAKTAAGYLPSMLMVRADTNNEVSLTLMN